MKSSLFLLAAQLVDERPHGNYSCCAISNAYAELFGSYSIGCDERVAYGELFECWRENFSPKLARLLGITDAELSVSLGGREKIEDELKETRVLALLFAYEIFKSEKKAYSKSRYCK